MDYFDEKTRGGGSKELNSGPLGVTCPPRLIRLCLLMQICMASLLVGVGMLAYAVDRASYYGLGSFAIFNLNTVVIDIV